MMDDIRRQRYRAGRRVVRYFNCYPLFHLYRRVAMGDKSPKNTQKQKQLHQKKMEEQKKKPAQPAVKK